MADELIRTCPIGESTVQDSGVAARVDEVMAAAEESSAQVEAGPPGMVGSSKEYSTWKVPVLVPVAVIITVVDLETGLRTIVPVPAEERVTLIAMSLSS
jgi:hypothetical protein